MTRFLVSLLLLSLLPNAAHAQPDPPVLTVFYVMQSHQYRFVTLDPITLDAAPICDVGGFTLTNVAPAPSPDGRAAALTLFQGEFEVADYTFQPTQQNSFIYLCDLVTGTAEKLSLPSANALDSSPSFSPDGSQLAWLRVTQPEDAGEPQTQVIVYDRQTATETILTTLEAMPVLGIAGGWIRWGAGGIAVREPADVFSFAPPSVTIYSPQGQVLVTDREAEPITPDQVMHEWALLDAQPVFVLGAEPPLPGTFRDRYTVLNPVSGAVEVIQGNPVRAILQAGDTAQEPVRHLAASPGSTAMQGPYVQAGLLQKPYQTPYDLAVAPDNRSLLVIDFSTMLRAGSLYVIQAADLQMMLGAFTFPVTPVDLPGVVPGEGGALAVYWTPAIWRFSS